MRRDVRWSVTRHLAVPSEAARRAFERHCECMPGAVLKVGETTYWEHDDLGLRTWIEDTVTFAPAGDGTDITYERRWHAPVFARLLGPLWAHGWQSHFESWQRQWERFLPGHDLAVS